MVMGELARVFGRGIPNFGVYGGLQCQHWLVRLPGYEVVFGIDRLRYIQRSATINRAFCARHA